MIPPSRLAATAMWPATMNARPPNILRSLNSPDAETISRTRSARCSSYAIVASETVGRGVLPGSALGRSAEPCLDDQLPQIGRSDPRQHDQDHRVAVEMGGREAHRRVVGQQRLLGGEVLDPCAENRPGRRLVTEFVQVTGAQRALEHE